MLLVGRQEGHPACNEWWGAGMVMCLERGAHLHTAQLMPLPLTVSCFSKIQIGFTFLVPALRVVPDKGPLNGCACILQATPHSVWLVLTWCFEAERCGRLHDVGPLSCSGRDGLVGVVEEVRETVTEHVEQTQQHIPRVVGIQQRVCVVIISRVISASSSTALTHTHIISYII